MIAGETGGDRTEKGSFWWKKKKNIKQLQDLMYMIVPSKAFNYVYRSDDRKVKEKSEKIEDLLGYKGEAGP